MNKKSIWAVVAGVLFVIIVTTLVDVVLHMTGTYSANEPMSNAQAIVATAYRIVIGVLGAWLTARLAPAQPMKHALILGVVGTLLGLVGIAMTYGKGMGPDWYPVALAVLAIPQSWLGGYVYVLKLKA